MLFEIGMLNFFTKLTFIIQILHFCPVDNVWREKWCKFFEIYEEFMGEKVNPYTEFQSNWGKEFLTTKYPQHIANVGGDGNCLFRAFSHIFTSGSQFGHMKIREKVLIFLNMLLSHIRSKIHFSADFSLQNMSQNNRKIERENLS